LEVIMVRDVDVRAFAAAHRDGAVVVDVRQLHEYVSGHVPGATLMPMATVRDRLRDLPGGRPVYVICATGRRSLIAASWMISAGIEQVGAAQRDLARIGIDHLAGAATGSPQDWAGGQPLASFPVASFTDLAAVRHHRPVTVLDVRRALERAGSHLDGALHIPLHELRDRIREVPPAETWVHCRSGYRAIIAASILQAAGHTVVAIDDEYTRAADAGLSLVTGTAAARAA
jgi:rhodanese-related sulfurtransferase